MTGKEALVLVLEHLVEHNEHHSIVLKVSSLEEQKAVTQRIAAMLGGMAFDKNGCLVYLTDTMMQGLVTAKEIVQKERDKQELPNGWAHGPINDALITLKLLCDCKPVSESPAYSTLSPSEVGKVRDLLFVCAQWLGSDADRAAYAAVHKTLTHLCNSTFIKLVVKS